MLHVLLDIVVDTDDPDRAVEIVRAHCKPLHETFELSVFSVLDDGELEETMNWRTQQDIEAVRKGL